MQIFDITLSVKLGKAGLLIEVEVVVVGEEVGGGGGEVVVGEAVVVGEVVVVSCDVFSGPI